MADRTQISQASGALEYSSLQWPKLATENCRKYTLIADVKSKFSGGTAVGFKNKKNVRGKCFTWLLHRKNLPLVKPNTDKWGERNRSSSRGGLYSNKQTKTQTWNFSHLLHLMHSTSFLHCFLDTKLTTGCEIGPSDWPCPWMGLLFPVTMVPKVDCFSQCIWYTLILIVCVCVCVRMCVCVLSTGFW